MGIGIVLITIMTVARIGLLRGQAFQPILKVLMQPPLVVVNKDTGGDVHGVAQQETFLNPAFLQAGTYVLGNVH